VVDPARPAPEHVSPEALRRTRADLLRQIAGFDVLLNADRDALRRTRDDLQRAVQAIDGLLATNGDDGGPAAGREGADRRRFRPAERETDAAPAQPARRS
jgi:hypothetical protein